MLTLQSATAPLSELTSFTAIRPQQLRVLTLPVLLLLNKIGFDLATAEIIIDTVAVFGYLLIVHKILSRHLPNIPGLGTLLAIIPLIVNYGIFGYVSYPSDLPALFLFAAAAYFTLDERFTSLCITAVLAAFNRETALLILPMFVLLAWHSTTIQKLTIRTIILSACIILPLILVHIIFQNNPGAVSEDHLGFNLSLLRQAFTLHRPGVVYALASFGGFHLLSLALIHRSPSVLKHVFVCSILLVLLLMPFSIYTEARVFNEANLGFTLPAIYGIFARSKAASRLSGNFA